MALLRVCPTTPLHIPLVASQLSVRATPRFSNFTVRSCNIPLELQPNESRKKWRQDFKVSELTEEAVKDAAQTGKAYVHDFLDVNDRPVLLVVASKHFPETQDPADDERLCVFLVEKALSKLPTGKEQILGIVDLRGFAKTQFGLAALSHLRSRRQLAPQGNGPGGGCGPCLLTSEPVVKGSTIRTSPLGSVPMPLSLGGWGHSSHP